MFILTLCMYAQHATVSGFLYDSLNHERLINASVTVVGSNIGCNSNEQGYYSLAVSKGPVKLRFSFVGHSPDTASLYIKGDTVLVFYLVPNSTINEVSVTGQSNNLPYNAAKLQVAELNKLPVLLGEPDIMKSMQLLPGVQSTSEGQAGFSVRGGDAYQNMILLDGVPVYNPNHFFGFFSIFNDKAIQDITMYKGDFPAQYGGSLSSVTDIRTREGNANQYSASASIGLLAASANLEGPLLNEKTTFFVSGRQSYLGLVATPLIKDFSSYSSANYDFYDLNAKLTCRVNSNNKISVSFYRSHDSGQSASEDQSESFTQQQGESWGNLLGSLTWNHVINPGWFLNTIVHYSKYDYSSSSSYGQDQQNEYAMMQENFQSTIYDEGLSTNLTWFGSPNFTMRIGASYTFHKYLPGVESSFNTDINSSGTPVNTQNIIGNEPITSNQLDLYCQGDIHISKVWLLNAGLHYTLYKNQVFYKNMEPRLNLVHVSGKSKVGLSFTISHQYDHLLTTSQISQASDLWVPSTTGINPERCIQYSLNIEHRLSSGYIASAELYYKTFNNLLAYQDGASYLNATSWESMVTSGVGSSGGISVTLEKKIGRTTGWITYTLSRTDRQFSLINNGESFPFDFDHRHDLKIVLLHKFSNRFDGGCTWLYHTGNYISFGNYKDPGNFIYVQRNNYELPAYHRLDIDLNYHLKKRRLEHVITLGVYNAYNHKNIYDVDYFYNYFKYSYTVKENVLLPIIPSITYRINFN